MPITVRDSGGQDFDPIPQGVFRGVCFALYDLGTHYDEMYKKDQHRCLIMWELPDVEPITVEKDGVKKTMPRSISKFYTLSLDERSNLRKDLQGWRGKAFTALELDGFDIHNILGTSCQIQVIHKTTNSGKVRQRVDSVLAQPAGSESLSPVNPLRYFSFEDGMDLPAETSEGIAKIITGSKEWAQMQQATPADLGDIDDRTDHGEPQEEESLCPF